MLLKLQVVKKGTQIVILQLIPKFSLNPWNTLLSESFFLRSFVCNCLLNQLSSSFSFLLCVFDLLLWMENVAEQHENIAWLLSQMSFSFSFFHKCLTKQNKHKKTEYKNHEKYCLHKKPKIDCHLGKQKKNLVFFIILFTKS